MPVRRCRFCRDTSSDQPSTSASQSDGQVPELFGDVLASSINVTDLKVTGDADVMDLKVTGDAQIQGSLVIGNGVRATLLGANDRAYWYKKKDQADRIRPGDVVGIVYQGASHCTDDTNEVPSVHANMHIHTCGDICARTLAHARTKDASLNAHSTYTCTCTHESE
jgi:hypothetical protein